MSTDSRDEIASSDPRAILALRFDQTLLEELKASFERRVEAGQIFPLKEDAINRARPIRPSILAGNPVTMDRFNRLFKEI